MLKPKVDKSVFRCMPVNQLTISEMFKALKAYERIGDYSTVSAMFKCSIDQVKAIVKHKQRLLDSYGVLPKKAVAKYIADERIRAEKIILLDKIVYEWFLRARRNPTVDSITYTVIQKTALDAKQILYINNFFVNLNWLQKFLQNYNIKNSDMKLQPNDPGPIDLNIKAIIAEVIKKEKKDKPSSPSYETLNCTKNNSSASSTLSLSKNVTVTRTLTVKAIDETKYTRNNTRLSLFDKIQALKAYEKIENWVEVARLFNCGVYQIKAAIMNKEKLMKQYESLPSHIRHDYEESQRKRAERISLLNKTVYEWFLRARRNQNVGFSSENFPFQIIALDVKKVLYIDNFFPDSAWQALFLKTYNITKSDMKYQANDPGPLNLDIKAIFADVIEREKIDRPLSQKTIQPEVGSMFKNNFPKLKLIEDKKERSQSNIWDILHSFTCKGPSFIRATKVSILGKVMFEWFLRARRNPSICPIPDDLIKQTALEVKHILYIDDFFPNNAWLAHFRQNNNILDSDMELQLNDSGPSDLDIEAIISKFVKEEKSERPSSPSYDKVDCDGDSSTSCSLPMLEKASASSSGLGDSQSGVEVCEGSLSNELRNASKLHSDNSSDITGHIRLPLLNQVRVIEAYEKTNSYLTVGQMFNSSPEDIKTIVDNKEEILAMTSTVQNSQRADDAEPQCYNRPKYIRAKKIEQHDMVMFEWFLRARRNPAASSMITNKSILKVAIEAKEALYIDNFMPNSVWVSQFRQKHNIRGADMELRPNDPGPLELDISCIFRDVAEREKINRPPSPRCDTQDFNDDSSASSSHSMSINEPLIRIQTNDSESSEENDEDPPSSDSELKVHSDESTKSRTNSLSLLNRVRAIEAYEKYQNLSMIARIFKCDRRQIRRIVDNKEEIMATFLSDRKTQSANNKETQLYKVVRTIRFKKIALLGRVMFEWFQRARRDLSIVPISDNLIKTTAVQVKNALNIDDFSPNHGWVVQFREKYGITDVDMNLYLNESRPLDLDIHAIIADVDVEERSESPSSPSCAIQYCNVESSASSPHPASINANATRSHLSESESNADKEDLPVKYMKFEVDGNTIEIGEDLPLKFMKFEVDENEIDSDEEPPSKYIKLEVDENKIESDEDQPSEYIKLEVDENKIESDEDLPSEYIKLEVDENKIESYEDLPSEYIKLEADVIKIESDEDTPSIYMELGDDVIKIESDEDDDKSTETTHNTYAINNLEQALEHLKPLEEFAFMKEDYRLIGSISQLEIALKNVKNKKNKVDS